MTEQYHEQGLTMTIRSLAEVFNGDSYIPTPQNTGLDPKVKGALHLIGSNNPGYTYAIEDLAIAVEIGRSARIYPVFSEYKTLIDQSLYWCTDTGLRNLLTDIIFARLPRDLQTRNVMTNINTEQFSTLANNFIDELTQQTKDDNLENLTMEDVLGLFLRGEIDLSDPQTINFGHGRDKPTIHGVVLPESCFDPDNRSGLRVVSDTILAFIRSGLPGNEVLTLVCEGRGEPILLPFTLEQLLSIHRSTNLDKDRRTSLREIALIITYRIIGELRNEMDSRKPPAIALPHANSRPPLVRYSYKNDSFGGPQTVPFSLS